MKRERSPLDRVEVAAPCSASWEEMAGNERVRFCDHCALNVYNLSAMSRKEAEEMVRAHEGRLCIRFYKRHDGVWGTAFDQNTGAFHQHASYGLAISHQASTNLLLDAPYTPTFEGRTAPFQFSDFAFDRLYQTCGSRSMVRITTRRSRVPGLPSSSLVCMRRFKARTFNGPFSPLRIVIVFHRPAAWRAAQESARSKGGRPPPGFSPTSRTKVLAGTSST